MSRFPARTRSSVAAVAIACLSAVLASGCAGSEELTCADAVLVDWNNGRLGGEYAPECYRDALEDLPEDARVYTTAPEEIKRALRSSLAASATRGGTTKKLPVATGGGSRRLSGRQAARKPSPARAEAEARAARAPESQPGPTALPLPVAITLTLILVAGAVGLASSVAKRRRARASLPDSQRDAVTPVADRPHLKL